VKQKIVTVVTLGWQFGLGVWRLIKIIVTILVVILVIALLAVLLPAAIILLCLALILAVLFYAIRFAPRFIRSCFADGYEENWYRVYQLIGKPACVVCGSNHNHEGNPIEHFPEMGEWIHVGCGIARDIVTHVTRLEYTEAAALYALHLEGEYPFEEPVLENLLRNASKAREDIDVDVEMILTLLRKMAAGMDAKTANAVLEDYIERMSSSPVIRMSVVLF
jgi:hypothetical protein